MGEPREGRARKLDRGEYVKLRDLLSARLSELGMSQRELGASLGVSTSYVNKLLLGKRTIEVTELIDICRRLDVDPADVVRSLL